jgi:hypothetical protein
MAPGSHHHGGTGPGGIDSTDAGSQPMATSWRAASIILDGATGGRNQGGTGPGGIDSTDPGSHAMAA